LLNVEQIGQMLLFDNGVSLVVTTHDNTVHVPLIAAVIITATFIPDYRGFTAVTAKLPLSPSPCSSLVRSCACAFNLFSVPRFWRHHSVEFNKYQLTLTNPRDALHHGKGGLSVR